MQLSWQALHAANAAMRVGSGDCEFVFHVQYCTVQYTIQQYSTCVFFCLQQNTLHLEYEYNTLQYSTLRCLPIKNGDFP